ncbi:hypothetical protein PANT111_160257 [Pantoea brenneri]|uniref:Uncharacterized protein n=1 Tax=Pantoea brenneri TaxID=472694 RepID=A0AAX3J4N7_9GAMM|nr:hypothetical protein PANT111_160257 [Pantoea brenneri]
MCHRTDWPEGHFLRQQSDSEPLLLSLFVAQAKVEGPAKKENLWLTFTPAKHAAKICVPFARRILLLSSVWRCC